MDIIWTVSIVLILINIVFGLYGYLAPDRTMDILGLRLAEGRLDGKSEVRAASGCAYIMLSVGALAIHQPVAFAMVGFAYLGGAIGRITSIVVDGSGSSVTWPFFVVEAFFAAVLIGGNLF